MKILQQHWMWMLITTFHGFILTKLVFFPYPELFVYPYLEQIGLKPYGQILDQHFPGLMFLPINLHNLGMINEVVARYWEIGIVVTIQLLLYVISLKIFESRKKAILVCLLYLVWQPFFEGWVLWIDSFLPLMLLPAFWFSYKAVNEGKNSQIMLAGLFLGLAIVFKQIVLPLSAMVMLMLWVYRRNLKTVVYFLAGLVPFPVLMIFYFWSINVFKDFWYWTVTFNLTTFAEYGKKPPFLNGLIKVMVVYLPTIGLWRMERKLAVVLGVYILGGLAAIYARFDFVHLQATLPFVMIATVLVMTKLSKSLTGKVMIALYIFLTIGWLGVFYRGHLSGNVMFFDSESKAIVENIKQLTDPGEEIFLWGTPMHWYLLSETVPAGRVFVFQFPWFLMVSHERILEGLVRSEPKLILRDSSVTMEGKTMTQVAPGIDNYIDQNYVPIKKIGNTEFMKRNEN